jgi:hypothetical protein
LMMSLVERAEGEAEAIQLRDNHHKIREWANLNYREQQNSTQRRRSLFTSSRATIQSNWLGLPLWMALWESALLRPP